MTIYHGRRGDNGSFLGRGHDKEDIEAKKNGK